MTHLTRILFLLLTAVFGGTALLASGCGGGGSQSVGITSKPGQPASGSGGSDYAFAGVAQIAYPSQGGTSFIFQPSSVAPETRLPVIAFQHGYDLFGNQLSRHRAMINHLVKKGYIVIYDEFQPELLTDPATYEANAAAMINDGISYIAQHPDACIQIAVDGAGATQFGLMGYSVGGVTSVNLAANYAARGIPKPKFLYTMEASNGGGHTTPTRDASTVPADTQVVMVMAEDDDVKTWTTSSTYWNQMGQIPASQKQWIGIFSDRYPDDPRYDLVADHASVTADPPDTLDFYGYFKWGTALADSAFAGKDKSYWWGHSGDLSDMGTWSDGTPVVPAVGSQQAFWPGH